MGNLHESIYPLLTFPGESKILVSKSNSSDAASGVYFLDYKSSAALSDREILHKHWAYRK